MPSTVFWCARCAQLNASSFLWPGGAYLRATASAWRRSDVVATSTQLALQGRHGCEQGRVLDTVLLARLHHSNDEVLVREEDACACVVSDASDARVLRRLRTNEGQQHPFVVSRDIDADHGFCSGFFDSAATQGPHGFKYARANTQR